MYFNKKGGKSDPYLVFQTEPKILLFDKKWPIKNKKHEIKTTIKNHTIQPNWKNEEIFLTLASTDFLNLNETAMLKISCWDYDQFNPDDLIGSGSISFVDIFEKVKKNEIFEFEIFLNKCSVLTGKISGKIKLCNFEKIFNNNNNNNNNNIKNSNLIPLDEAYKNYLRYKNSNCSCTIN